MDSTQQPPRNLTVQYAVLIAFSQMRCSIRRDLVSQVSSPRAREFCSTFLVLEATALADSGVLNAITSLPSLFLSRAMSKFSAELRAFPQPAFSDSSDTELCLNSCTYRIVVIYCCKLKFDSTKCEKVQLRRELVYGKAVNISTVHSLLIPVVNLELIADSFFFQENREELHAARSAKQNQYFQNLQYKIIINTLSFSCKTNFSPQLFFPRISF